MGVGFLEQDLRRRSFLKWSSAVAGSGALVGAALSFTGIPGVGSQKVAAAGDGMADADRTVWSACVVNCGSRCPIRLQIKDGTVARVLPDNTGDDTLFNRQIRACVRGRNMRQRIYSPDRIKAPLKRREGTERGDGQWDEISWDEAFDLFAEKLKYTIDTYGNEAIFKVYGSGVWNAHLGTSGGWGRLFNLLGGYLGYYSNYSYSQIGTITRFHYGNPDEQISNSFEDSIRHGGPTLTSWTPEIAGLGSAGRVPDGRAEEEAVVHAGVSGGGGRSGDRVGSAGRACGSGAWVGRPVAGQMGSRRVGQAGW